MIRPLKYLLALTAIAASLPIAAITFGTSAPPKRLDSINASIRTLDLSGLPQAQVYTARDGEKLRYRAYDGDPSNVVVVLHGSTARSDAVHPLARHLNASAGRPTVYALDLRGHGASGRRGDISYIGQLEHDLEDFLAERRARHAVARWRLVGFSSGGGFALRVAGSPVGRSFDRVVLLAPMLDPQGPTYRADGGWAAPHVPRIIALTLLDSGGITRWHSLPAVAFAPRDNGEVPTYSFRLLTNFGVGRAWSAYLKAAPKPPVVLVGAKDELFVADAFQPMLAGARPDVRVTVLPGLGHMDMTTAPRALDALTQALFAD